MKKLLFSVLVSLLSPYFSVGQKSSFIHPEFGNITETHRLVAIVPFDIDLDLSLSELKRRQLSEEEGISLQKELTFYIANQIESLSVQIQPYEETKALMRSSGIDYRSSLLMESKDLASRLKVDAVIRGSLSLSVLLSEGIEDQFSWIDLWVLSPSFGRITLKLVDGGSSKLLWRHEKVIDRTTGKNTRELVEKMMKQIARNFPYAK
ncbi:MAG: hypothetical protein ACPGYU_00080 [Flavobacteriaceae bacterium]